VVVLLAGNGTSNGEFVSAQKQKVISNTRKMGSTVPLLIKIGRSIMTWTGAAVFLVAPTLVSVAHAQAPRKVIIDEDASGPGGSNMLAILALVNSPQTEVLGITVMTGVSWRDEEVLHALRLLEIIGRTDIPVVPGATCPLVNSRQHMVKWEKLYGKIAYKGAWNHAKGHIYGPTEIPPMPEGRPTTKPSDEDAAHFLVRMVRQYPHEITIYAAGPMTDLALAITIEPRFAELTKELIAMGGSIDPQTSDPLLSSNPRREFNFWMDPEASRSVLHARWPRLVLTTVDISVKTYMGSSLITQLAKGSGPSAKYAARYAKPGYMWDELAALAWLDPSLITKREQLYVDVNVQHMAGYGDTLSWAPGHQPGLGEQLVEVQQDLDKTKFYQEFVDLLMGPTPARILEGSRDVARLRRNRKIP
jgi:inosine-uridine nucleoside N-ribohydrolase